MNACDACLRRTWLVERLSGYLDYQRNRVDVILGLDDQTLINFWIEIRASRGIDDQLEREYQEFGADQAEAARRAVHRDGRRVWRRIWQPNCCRWGGTEERHQKGHRPAENATQRVWA